MEPCRHRVEITALLMKLRDAERDIRRRKYVNEEQVSRIARVKRDLDYHRAAQKECRYCQDGY